MKHEEYQVTTYQDALQGAVKKYHIKTKKLSQHDEVDLHVLSGLIVVEQQTLLELRENLKARLAIRKARGRSWFQRLFRDYLAYEINKVNNNKQFCFQNLLKLDCEANKKLNLKLQGLILECEELKKQQATLVVEIQQLETDAEIAAGQTVINKLSQTECELHQALGTVESLREDICRRDEIIGQCQQELEQARNDRDQSNLSVKQLFGDVQTQDKKIIELQNKNIQLKATIETLAVEMREVEQSQQWFSRSAPV